MESIVRPHRSRKPFAPTQVCVTALIPPLLICLAVASGDVSAQTSSDVEAARRQAEVLQRLEQQRQRQDVEKFRPSERPPEGIDTKRLLPKPEASAAGPGCHTIREIVISSAPHLSTSVREQINARFAGKCLGVAEIEQILGEITKAYVMRGYIAARAYLPAQNLTQGRLEITVIEGKVSRIRIEDDGQGSVSLGNAFPGVEGDVLNLRDLEQGIDQINRLASNDARLDILPGDAPGESIVVVRNQPRRRLHLTLSYDNQGDSSTGERQSGVTLGVDSPLALDDFITVTHRKSTPGDERYRFSSSESLLYSLALGYATVSLGQSHSRHATPMQLPSGLELVSSGSTTTDYVAVDRVMYRDQASKATLGTTLTTRESANYLGGNFLQVGSRNLTVLEIDGSAATRLGDGALLTNLGISQGLAALGALKDADGAPDSAPRAQFRKYRLGVAYTLPFRWAEHDLTFSTQFTGQYAAHVLYGSEQMLIGGLYTVRGFVRNTLSGDHGYFWRNEASMRLPIPVANTSLNSRIFIAYDQGQVLNRGPDVPSGRLAGTALGLSLSWQGAVWEWFCTRALSGPSWMNLEGTQGWFRVSFSM